MSKLTKIAAATAVAMGLGLGVAGQAQADVFWTGTVTEWLAAGAVQDADLDSWWTLTSYGDGTGGSTDIDAAQVTLAETEIGGIDYYTATLDFTPLPDGGLLSGQSSFWNYWVQQVDEEFLNASLDSTVPAALPNVTVTKNIYDAAGNLMTTLVSLQGNPDGPNAISGLYINVNETFVASATAGALLTGTTDTYAVGVPEPATLALLGLGLAGLGWARRRAVH